MTSSDLTHRRTFNSIAAFRRLMPLVIVCFFVAPISADAESIDFVGANNSTQVHDSSHNFAEPDLWESLTVPGEDDKARLWKRFSSGVTVPDDTWKLRFGTTNANEGVGAAWPAIHVTNEVAEVLNGKWEFNFAPYNSDEPLCDRNDTAIPCLSQAAFGSYTLLGAHRQGGFYSFLVDGDPYHQSDPTYLTIRGGSPTRGEPDFVTNETLVGTTVGPLPPPSTIRLMDAVHWKNQGTIWLNQGALYVEDGAQLETDFLGLSRSNASDHHHASMSIVGSGSTLRLDSAPWWLSTVFIHSLGSLSVEDGGTIESTSAMALDGTLNIVDGTAHFSWIEADGSLVMRGTANAIGVGRIRDKTRLTTDGVLSLGKTGEANVHNSSLVTANASVDGVAMIADSSWSVSSTLALSGQLEISNMSQIASENGSVEAGAKLLLNSGASIRANNSRWEVTDELAIVGGGVDETDVEVGSLSRLVVGRELSLREDATIRLKEGSVEIGLPPRLMSTNPLSPPPSLIPNTVHIGEGGLLTGSGGFEAESIWVNDGTLSPGTDAAAGTITNTGNLDVSAESTVALDLGPEWSDSVQIDGQASLSGSLRLQLVQDYVPKIGETFELISAQQGIVGQFSHEYLTSPDDSTGWVVEYEPKRVVLRIAPDRLPGDVNQDNMVDASDAAVLFANWGRVVPDSAEVDFNDDGVVDAFDAQVFLSAWTGDRYAGVPEPAANGLAMFVMMLVRSLRRQHIALLTILAAR